MLSMFWCIILEKNCDHGVLAFLSLFGSLLQRKEVVVFRGLILHFMTGLSKIPPLGLEKNIDIEFDMSSTCLQSRLLLKHVVLCWEFQPLIRILRPSMEKFWKRLSYVVCNFEHLSLMLTYLFTDVLCLIWITTVKCSQRNFMHYDLITEWYSSLRKEQVNDCSTVFKDQTVQTNVFWGMILPPGATLGLATEIKLMSFCQLPP